MCGLCEYDRLRNVDPYAGGDGLEDPAINNHVQSTNTFIRGLQSSFIWSESGTVVLSYSFAETTADLTHIQSESSTNFPGITGTYNPLSSSTGNDAALKADIVLALEAYEMVADVDFNEVADFDSTGVDFQFAGFDNLASAASGGGLNGRATFPRTDPVGSSTTNWEAFIFMNTSSANMTRNAELGAGSHRLHVSLHEIGHSMGLTHPQDNFEGDGWTTSANTGAGDHALDNNRYTVMSAERGGLDQNSQFRDHGYATTMMALDVAALHHMYGSSDNHTGDTTYTLTDPETAALDLNGNSDNTVSIGRAFYSIWDTGGTDEITYGGSNRVLINLNEATLDVTTDPSHVDGWQFELRGSSLLSGLSQELQDDLLDPEYHAGGFFSRVINNDGTAVLGGYSIANGTLGSAAHAAAAVIENATGGDQNDILIGNEQDNVLTGNDGDDYIHGSAGNDTIIGGEGNNNLNGGNGNDTFVFNAGETMTSGRIDGDGDTDKILFRGVGVVDLSSVSVQVNSIEEIEFEAETFLTGSRVVRLSSQELDQANEFSPTLLIDGFSSFFGATTDTIEITMDTNSLDISGWTFTDFGTAGGDANETITITAGDSRDGITGSSQADIVFGNGGNDTIIGGAGNDHLDGGTGADEMLGGLGNDEFIVDDAGDIVFEQANEGTDTVFASISYALRDQGQHLENLVLTGMADLDGTGNGLNNTITGNSGDNILDGAWGDDTLIGGGGNDTFRDNFGADQMIGGTGDDTYRVDNVGDTVVELENEGNDIVESTIAFSLRDQSQHLENLTLLGTDNINGTGNGLSNIITGNSGDNILDGAWGDDTLIGGGGNDTFRDNFGADRMLGGTGDDTYLVDNVGDVVVELSGQGNDTVESRITFALRDQSQHLENLTLLGTDNINGTGNGLNNTITGNSGDNILDGAWGDDTLIGGGGNDTFRDNFGADQMIGGTGDDTYRVDNVGDTVLELSGQGNDTVESTIAFSLRDQSQHIENLTLIGTGNVNATGNGLVNTIRGNSGNNFLNGAWGNDTLIGGGGNDIFRDDFGNEIMSGGAGADTFIFAGNFGQDRILDFNLNEANERIDLSAVNSITDFNDLVSNHAQQSMSDTVINDGSGNSITLVGINVSNLSSDDFIF